MGPLTEYEWNPAPRTGGPVRQPQTAWDHVPKAEHQGSPYPTDRMHPHQPHPNPSTGKLVVDPEITLRAEKFNPSLSFYYGSMSTDRAGPWTFTYSANGNLSVVLEPGKAPVTMSYHIKNRLAVNKATDMRQDPPALSVASYAYDGDGLKRRELVDGAATTLMWDGSDYLGEKS